MAEENHWTLLRERVAKHARQVFSDYSLLLVQHVLDDLFELVSGYITLGCEPADITIVGIPYSSRIDAADRLRSLGCRVLLPTAFPMDGTLALVLHEVLQRCKSEGKRLIIVEDGGYVVSLASEIHRMDGYGSIKDLIQGAVEQTTRGKRLDIELMTRGRLDFPVITIADCKTKERVEPPYIGMAVIRNLNEIFRHLRVRLPSFKLQQVAIFGFGPIGRHLAKHLKNTGATVYASDPKFELEIRHSDFAEPLNPVEHIAGCDLVIGCTGRTSIDGNILSMVKNDALVASASSRQIEIDVDWINFSSQNTQVIQPTNDALAMVIPAGRRVTRLVERFERSLVIVYDGYPVNFWGTSLPDYVGAVVLSLLLEGAVALAQGGLSEAVVYSGSEVLKIEEIDIYTRFLDLKPNDGIELRGAHSV